MEQWQSGHPANGEFVAPTVRSQAVSAWLAAVLDQTGARAAAWVPAGRESPVRWRFRDLPPRRGHESARGLAVTAAHAAGLRPGGVLRLGARELDRLPLARARGLQQLVLIRSRFDGSLYIESDAPIEVADQILRGAADGLAGMMSSAHRPLFSRSAMEPGTAGLTHDLRNQLTLAALEFRRVAAQRADLAGGLRAAERALEEASRLCTALLGGAPEPSRSVRVREFVERELAGALELARRPDPARLELACPRGLVARLRPTLFARALRNLVLNALQATGSGGQVRVQVSAAAAHDLCIEVVDDGPGMTREELARCVRPGQSGRGSTGLGIASVLDCVEAMGGVFELESARGKGTRATLRLPGSLDLSRAVGLLVDPAPPGDGGGREEIAATALRPEPASSRPVVVASVQAALEWIGGGAVRSVSARRSLPAPERVRLAERCAASGVSFAELSVVGEASGGSAVELDRVPALRSEHGVAH